MSNDAWFRPEVLALPAYVPGGKVDDPDIIKLASNEMPFHTLPAVQAVVQANLGELNRYPDMFGVDLIADLAAFHDWPTSGIVLGNGSTSLIEKVLQAVVTPGGDVVIPWRSFEAYPIAIGAAGGTAVKVPLLADGSHDLDAMAAATTADTRAVMVCSPNNPTGVALTHTALAAFLEKIPATVPVLLDEAYIDFADMDDAVDSRALLEAHPNLIVLRTFSKAYGLAGLRCGYALTSPEMAGPLTSIMTPFGVNTLAQVAAQAALNSQVQVRANVEFVQGQRAAVQQAAAEAGLEVPTSQSNFLWFALGAESERFQKACEAEKLVVRRFGDEGVRVSVAEASGTERLIRALAAFTAAR